MFHPRPAQWFDLMVPQDGLCQALEVLANTGPVELESGRKVPPAHGELAQLSDGLETYFNHARRYGPYWPKPDRTAPFPSLAPKTVLDDTLGRVEAWIRDARDTVQTLQDSQAREADLHHLEQLLHGAAGQFPVRLLDMSQDGFFKAVVYLLHEGHRPAETPVELYVQHLKAPTGDYLLIVGEAKPLKRFETELAAHKARRIHLPDAIDTECDLERAIVTRLDGESHRQNAAWEELDAINTRHDLARARATLERLGWLAAEAGPTDTTQNFARITGWTAVDPERLERALADTGLDAVLNVGPPPEGKRAPMLLQNPFWAKPFELFVRLLGQPGASEADPSPILALMAPLLFGYMFGDVGQGLVLMAAGVLLRPRLPDAAPILIAGGLFSTLFGFAFGSIFAREDVIPALWLHPINEPIPVLAVALGLGVVILLTGLGLGGASAFWRGEAWAWWRAPAGLIVAYVGVLGAFWDSRVLALTGVGALWFVLGSTLGAQKARGQALGHALGEVVETLFQLLINTLSFVRVGAFAIAHAGLSSMVVIMAEGVGGKVGYWGVMVMGNLFIIALEGLVAGIQTTRLVLFEFFIRFLRAEGRALKALPTPEAWAMQFQGRTS